MTNEGVLDNVSTDAAGSDVATVSKGCPVGVPGAVASKGGVGGAGTSACTRYALQWGHAYQEAQG